MKLIDHIIKEDNTQTEKHVWVDGKEFNGWIVAKPLNVFYDGFWTRFRDAIQVLRGKAIGVQYFDDLTDKQKQKFVKTEKKR
jgi:hypothetical protein